MNGSGDSAFPTFCHISDLGPYGYKRLHRLIAVSQPLTLWSPSSVLLQTPGCRVSPREFIKLIEDGVIRIIGREPWLMDKGFRNNHDWPGARWDPYVDGAIRDIYYRDQYGNGAQRVMVAPEESGKSWARDFLEEHPEQVDFWSRVLTGDRPAEQIPPGTFDSIQRMPWNPYSAAEYVLRSARNHGQAMADAGAEVDFLLHPADAEFMRVLATVQVGGPVTGIPRPQAEANPYRIVELANDLIEVLMRLDDVRGRGGLMKFIRTGGHAQLVAWFRAVCDTVKATEAGSVEGEILRQLSDQVQQGRRRGMGSLLAGTLTAVPSAAGAGIDGVQAIADLSLLNVLGVAFSAMAIGAGMLQRLGLAPGSFTGVQWPYLYTYGKPASGQRKAHLLDLLDNIA